MNNQQNSQFKAKNILIISDEGSVGKTFCTINIIDQLRAQGKSVAAFLCDVKHDQLIEKLGEKDEHNFPLAEQDPFKGVFKIDLMNQNGGDAIYAADQKSLFLTALSNESEFSIFDFPATSIPKLIEVFNANESNDEMADILSLNEKDLYIVIPAGDHDKAGGSIDRLTQKFKFDEEKFPGLNDRIHFVVIINEQVMLDKQVTKNDFFKTQAYQAVSNYPRYHEICLPKFEHIFGDEFKALNKPYSHFFNFESGTWTNIPNNTRWFQLKQTELKINLRKLVKGSGDWKGFRSEVNRIFVRGE